MTKPLITTRAGKGSALSYDELDANFTNIKDATLTLTADTGGTSVIADLNGTITLVAGTNVTITGNNSSKEITISATSGGGGGTMSGFTLSADTGSAQSIGDADNVSILGGTGLTTTASATDSVTIDLDDTAVSAGTYNFATITVDAQGRLTAASTPSYINLPIGNFGGSAIALYQTYEVSNAVTQGTGTWALDTYYPQRVITLTGNVTFTATSGVDFPQGSRCITVIKQDNVGSRTATWASNILFEGGANPTLSTAAYSQDLLIVYNVYGTFYAQLFKGFA